jgi:hypothetical protein
VGPRAGWTGMENRKSFVANGIRSPDLPVRSEMRQLNERPPSVEAL